jgi:TonB family protein
MRRFFFGLFVLAVMAWSPVKRANAQTLPGAKPSEMGKRLSEANPTYPPAAKRQGIQGAVLLAVTVSEKGDVKDVQLLAGPPELAAAAADTVRQWRYAPYLLEGEPSAVITTAFVMFRLSDQPAFDDDRKNLDVLADLYPLHAQCRYLIEKKEAEEATETCRESAELSEQLPAKLFGGYHILSWDEYAVFLLKQDQAAEALAAFDKECGYAGKLLQTNDKTYGIAFWHRALAQQTLHQNAAADADFTTAEKSLAEAMTNQQDIVVRRNAELALNKVLSQHASLLDSEGRHEDAQKLRVRVTH